MCFLCDWDSCAKSQYSRKIWPLRTNYEPGVKNVKNEPLVSPGKIILPALHIELGLFKNFVKALEKEGRALKFLVEKFGSVLTTNKIKEGMFVGPQIRRLTKWTEFDDCLTFDEKQAWEAFKDLKTNFLGNHKSPDYQDKVENLLRSYEKINVKMSLKIHFLNSHLNFFPENLGAVSDQHGEKFHQTISRLETHFTNKSKLTRFMLADYVWFNCQNNTNNVHRRKVLFK
jgi:hypothetical protein